MKTEISSDRFIELFITLNQLELLQNNKEANLYNLNWSFNINLLNEFIYHSLKDYRYRDFLSCFKYTNEYSIDLILSLNRAVAKHLLTGIYDYEAYISKFYVNMRIIDDNHEFKSLMLNFLEDFKFFCLDKETYKKNSDIYSDALNLTDNSRTIFDLQRRIKDFK